MICILLYLFHDFQCILFTVYAIVYKQQNRIIKPHQLFQLHPCQFLCFCSRSYLQIWSNAWLHQWHRHWRSAGGSSGKGNCSKSTMPATTLLGANISHEKSLLSRWLYILFPVWWDMAVSSLEGIYPYQVVQNFFQQFAPENRPRSPKRK